MSNESNTQHPADEAAAAIAGEDAAKAAEELKELSEAPLSELENEDPAKLMKLLETTATDAAEGGEDAPGTDTVTSGQPDAANDPAKDTAAPAVVPKPRFDEVINERNQLKEEIAKLREAKAFVEGKVAGSTPPAPPAVDPVVKIDADLEKLDKDFNQNMLDLAKKFDDGDLTLVQLRTEEQKLKSTTQQVYNTLTSKKREVLVERSTPSPETLELRINSNPALQAATDKIRSENPWLDKISDDQLAALTDQAWLRADRNGVPITKDAQGTWKLRYFICEIGKEWGWDKLYPADAPPAPASAATPTQTPAKTPGNITPEQRKAKLDLANKQPPLPTAAGVNAPTDVIGTYNTENMSDVQMSALPKGVLEKMAGLT